MQVITFDKPGAKVKLSAIDTAPPDGQAREQAEERFQALGEELFELQDLMFGARTHGLLLVLQGRDTAGKDGTIKQVVGAFNPRGVHVASFGVPTEEELRHDFLWRVHREAPGRGQVAIFNRSHYEDVLVVRVHGLCDKEVWKDRYEQINGFEETLAAHGVIVLKFFLHISKKEQEERLLEREQETEKAWKLNANDWRERAYWDDYTAAYEDAICSCASARAPWIVVPADKKWYRNLVVSEAVCAALRPYRETWQKTLEAMGRKGRAELEAFRAESREGGGPRAVLPTDEAYASETPKSKEKHKNKDKEKNKDKGKNKDKDKNKDKKKKHKDEDRDPGKGEDNGETKDKDETAQTDKNKENRQGSRARRQRAKTR